MKIKTRYTFLTYLLIVSGMVLTLRCQSKEPVATVFEEPSETILFDYVHKQDPAFQYEPVHSLKENGYTFHVIRMVSQHWLSPELVDETEWWHWVSVVVPDEAAFQTGLMWIGGGSKNSKMPEKADPLLVETATRTNSIVAQVHNIPFQPLTFANDTFGERFEDELISYGWRKFLEGGAKDEDAIWLARLPMTKAVMAAMDAVTEFVKTEYDKNLDSYVVAGASKRGWTTWTTAAVDDRVVGIIPVVIDLLNIEPSFQHHWRNYGYWAPAVQDYVREGIMEWQGSREYDRLLEITEPYSFLDKYDMPKLLINASGDQFFQPDSWQFYWDSLQEEKHLQYVPNAGHDVRETDALQNMIVFYASILNELPRPEYHWAVTENGFKIETDPSQKAVSIKLWQAHNPESRDFRIDVFGPHWNSSEIKLNESGNYEITLDTPEKGWKGYFVEITYPGQVPLKVTTGVEVLPKTYPFEKFQPAKPKGKVK